MVSTKKSALAKLNIGLLLNDWNKTPDSLLTSKRDHSLSKDQKAQAHRVSQSINQPSAYN